MTSETFPIYRKIKAAKAACKKIENYGFPY